jgi:hypoxanthine phosphoribosyltransferase
MSRIKLHDKVFEPIIQYKEIELVIENMAHAMRKDLEGKEPLFISVLNGSFMFTAELLKRLDFICHVSFVKLSSYSGSESSGQVRQLIGLNEDIEGKTVIILEDIVDTGLTINHLIYTLEIQKPAVLKTACLLYKPGACKTEVKPDYVGFEVKDNFLVGFGLDYNGLGRNFKDIYQFLPENY